mgnify:CR=1 FL=1
MTYTHTLLETEEHHDPLDSYFECINSCSWFGGEDVECVTRCVEVHLKQGNDQS